MHAVIRLGTSQGNSCFPGSMNNPPVRENDLEEDEYYICDIIGAKVITDTEEEFGTLTDVLQTGANDVYVVKTKEGKEVLLPVIKECILDVNVNDGIVRVHIMPGLI